MTGGYDKCDEGASCYRKYLDGDKSAFDNIINLYHDSLIYFIYGILHNTADAEDVAADVFADLIINKNRYGFRCSLKTYIFSVARHKAIDRFRREKHIYDGDFELATENIADAEHLEETVISGERSKLVRDAIKELSADYAEVLTLSYIHGLTGDEICNVTGKSKKQIANLTYRGKEALKNILTRKGEGLL